MKWGQLIAIVLAAVLAGAAGIIAAAGMGGPTWLAASPIGHWLGLRSGTPLPANGVTPARAGQVIGPLVLTDLNGQTAMLPLGRPVLVNVWASWCAPCRAEMPLLARFAAAQGRDGVAVVGLAEDDAASVGDFLRKSPVGYLVVLDDPQWRAGTRLGNGLGVLPFTALLDADGRLLKSHVGPFASTDAIAAWAQATP